MIAEEKRQQYRKQQRKKHRQIQIRRQKIKFKIYIALIIILLYGVGCFLLGNEIGENTTTEQIYSHTTESLSYEKDEDSEYNLEDAAAYDSYENAVNEIILVNKDNPLPDYYEVNLLTLPDGVNRAAEEAYTPLCDMLNAGRREGLNFEICSSYRDVARQIELFEEDVNILLNKGYTYTEAYDEVARETMPPGCSEHSTGLAFDIVALDYQLLNDEQQYTDENMWLREHCVEYGFILRYPLGKEDITGIDYESWHFRYVGIEAAQYITENNITLEEYLEFSNVF